MSRIPPTGNSSAPKNQDNFSEEGEDKKTCERFKKEKLWNFRSSFGISKRPQEQNRPIQSICF